MLLEGLILGGLFAAVVGVFEVSIRLDRLRDADINPESALRAAMQGTGGAAVRAEYRRRVVVPPVERPVAATWC